MKLEPVGFTVEVPHLGKLEKCRNLQEVEDVCRAWVATSSGLLRGEHIQVLMHWSVDP